MLDVKDTVSLYVSEFERLEKAGADPAWLVPIRKAGIAQFAELGFPSVKLEEWKYTSVAPIAETPFAPAPAEPAVVHPREIEPYLFGGEEVHRLVFVDGRHVAELSSDRPLPRGVTLGSLAAAIAGDGKIVRSHLARHAGCDAQPFTAMNTALFRDGALLHVAAGTVVERPLHVVYVTTERVEPMVTHPRTLIVLDESSQATVVETFASVGGGVHFTNPVSEIVVGENAVADHYWVQRESDRAYLMGTLQVHQRRSSNFSSHVLTLGGHLLRNEIGAYLDGEGCECTLNGLYLLDGSQHLDNHLRVDHAKPHCNSRENFRGVLDGRSRGVFTGRIVVHKDAQKTDAKQSNMNLLLSEAARVDTKPQLEIFANDVKCTHGATIGQVDRDALFYLRSRGIPSEAARSLLIYGFAAESIGQIRVEALRAQIESLLFVRLPQSGLPETTR